MTRAVPARTLTALTEQQALALASTVPVGRVVHARDDRLFVTPVNFLLVGSDVFLRTTEHGELMTAAEQHCSAAFEVDDLVDWSRSGWSVLVRGRLSRVTDGPELLRVLADPTSPWAGGERRHVLVLTGVEVTGRRIEPGPGGTSVVHQ